MGLRCRVFFWKIWVPHIACLRDVGFMGGSKFRPSFEFAVKAMIYYHKGH